MAKKALFDFTKGQKSPAKNIAIGALAALSALYLVNPGAGFFEILPDNIPFLGNVDEFTAVMLLLSSLKYFGLDLLSLFGGGDSTEQPASEVTEPRYEPPPAK